MIQFQEPPQGGVKVRVIGVGNAGGMITKRVARERLPGVECCAINTAIKDLGSCPEIRTLQIGASLTRGNGAGMDPKIGAKAALEDANRIRDFLGQNDIVLLIAGFGKGTGTGATPEIGAMARDLGALTFAFVTTPFAHEPRSHHENAAGGLACLPEKVDAWVPLPNQRLSDPAAGGMTLQGALDYMDEAILAAVRGLVDVLLQMGRMSLDLADLRTLFKGSGRAAFALGAGKGDTRVADVLRGLSRYPFVQDVPLGTAHSLLLSVAGGTDLGLAEMDELKKGVAELTGGDRGASSVLCSESLQGELRAMIFGAGFGQAVEHTAEYPLYGDGGETQRGGGLPHLRGTLATGRMPRSGTDGDGFPSLQDSPDMPAFLRRGVKRNGPVAGGRG